MTRRSVNWQKAARTNIDDMLYEIEGELDDRSDEIDEILTQIHESCHKEEPDIEGVKERAKELRTALIELGRLCFELASNSSKMRKGAIPRNLKGKEPIGYSTPDGGAKHDVYHASIAQNRQLSKELYWPLDLNNKDRWDKEKAGRTRDDVDPVKATGTKKYTRNIGGGTVHVIVDERGRSPI